MSSGFGERLYGQYEDFISYLLDEKGFKTLGEGSFRAVYYRNNIVIKVPYTTDGINDNILEAKAWRLFRNKPMKNGVVAAPCRLLHNQCLMMVKVKHVISDDLPEWAWRIDGMQAGDYKGRIVAYDYACDIPERTKWEKEFGMNSEWFSNNRAYKFE